MHDDGDIGRPIHHSIDPDELPLPPGNPAPPSQAVRDLIDEITRRYPALDAERVHAIVRDRRHDVPLAAVVQVMSELGAGTGRRSRRS
jgi:hypothetical protein